jgi:HD superfamily phosphohydrolase YqeK
MSHEHYLECIAACQRCAVAADHCASECLEEIVEIKRMTHCIRLNRSCADLCNLAVREMSRGSEFAEQACQLCAEACELCATECGKHEMEHCQACAQACRECAEACRQVAGLAARAS